MLFQRKENKQKGHLNMNCELWGSTLLPLFIRQQSTKNSVWSWLTRKKKSFISENPFAKTGGFGTSYF